MHDAPDAAEIHRQLNELHTRLESHYHEVQDFEFTIEKGTLYCLQTRNGKMNARALVRTSVEMFNEGLITKERALLRVAIVAEESVATAEAVERLMGAKPEARFAFIQERAPKSLELVDL